MPRLCEVYSGICLTTEEKARKKTSVRVAGECQLAKNIRNRAYMSIRIHIAVMNGVKLKGKVHSRTRHEDPEGE